MPGLFMGSVGADTKFIGRLPSSHKFEVSLLLNGISTGRTSIGATIASCISESQDPRLKAPGASSDWMFEIADYVDGAGDLWGDMLTLNDSMYQLPPKPLAESSIQGEPSLLVSGLARDFAD